MELTDPVKSYLREVAASLRGFDRRLFMARTVRELGPNGQRRAERELGWNRVTIRKATHELDSGIRCLEAFSERGRKSAEEHLPGLLADVRDLVDASSQIDPTFDTQRLYTRLTAAEVRRRLISRKGYSDGQLPSEETIRRKMHQLGYRLRKVVKSKPKKSYPRPTPSSPS
jgi:hypothetical protein